MASKTSVPDGYKTFCYNFSCYKSIASAPLACGKCGRAFYCGTACQKKDWKAHKPFCCLDKRTQASHPHHEVARLELQALSLSLEEEVLLAMRTVLHAGTDKSQVETHFFVFDLHYTPSQQMRSKAYDDAGEVRKKFALLGGTAAENDDAEVTDFMLSTKNLLIKQNLVADLVRAKRPIGETSGKPKTLCHLRAWVGAPPAPPQELSTKPLPWGSSVTCHNTYYDQLEAYTNTILPFVSDPATIWGWYEYFFYRYATYKARHFFHPGSDENSSLFRMALMAIQESTWSVFKDKGADRCEEVAIGTCQELIKLYPSARIWGHPDLKKQLTIQPTLHKIHMFKVGENEWKYTVLKDL